MEVKINEWWLRNKSVLDLEKIAQDIWNLLESKIYNVVDILHYDSMKETTIDLLYNQLPIQPFTDVESKKNFVRYYEQYLEEFGTVEAIEKAGQFFNIDNFRVEILRFSEYSAYYPFHMIRIWIPEKHLNNKELKNFIRFVGPGRSVFHTHYVVSDQTALGYNLGECLGE